jgi:hypothetical protein
MSVGINGQCHSLARLEFWSDAVPLVTLDTTPTTIAGAPIVVDLPPNSVVLYAFRILRIGRLINTNAAPNGLDGATVPNTSQVIQTGNGAYIDSIKMADDGLSIEGSSERGAIEIMGNINIVAEVSKSDTYLNRWLLAKAKQDNLLLRDLQLGLIVWTRWG